MLIFNVFLFFSPFISGKSNFFIFFTSHLRHDVTSFQINAALAQTSDSPLFSRRFAKNLSPDKINLSTLKGEGQLTNLELDEEVLQSLLDLPTWLAINRVCCNKAAIRVSEGRWLLGAEKCFAVAGEATCKDEPPGPYF